MKRIVLWFMSTLTALVLLFGYNTSTSSQASASADSSAVAPVSGGTSAATDGSTSSPTATPDATGSGSSTSSTSTGTTPTTVTGDAASTRYGPVQVELTLANGTITDVTVVEYPDSDGKDQQINARALPILVQETVEAQSDSIDMVSGATYTSEGYLESLQSALDQAGL